ncbi:MAG: sigma factor [Velocimicrobium sp.]
MLDRTKFLEMLRDLKDIAATQGNALTQKEMKEYFNEMDLSEEHYQHIYNYLAENQIEIDGFEGKKVVEVEKDEPMSEADSIYLKMYLKELRMLDKLTKEEESLLLQEVKMEKPGAKERFIHDWLPKVVRIARMYKNQGVLLEDLIQEGNIGLLSGIDTIVSLEDTVNVDGYLKNVIRKAVEASLLENESEEDLENALLGRINLIDEATKYLARELGRVATIDELAEYTKLSVEEITDIQALSLDAVKVGSGE